MTKRMFVQSEWEISTTEENLIRLKNSRDARAPLYEAAKATAKKLGLVSPVGRALVAAVFTVIADPKNDPGHAILRMEWDQDETARVDVSPVGGQPQSGAAGQNERRQVAATSDGVQPWSNGDPDSYGDDDMVTAP